MTERTRGAMRIYVVRHGAAIEPETPGVPDAERWLTADGRERFRRAARRFGRLKRKVAAIYTSPLVRAVQTADILADEIRYQREISVWPELADEAAAGAVVERLRQLERGPAAIVGHEPQCSLVSAALLGLADLPVSFPKGGILALTLEEDGRGAFRWLLEPKRRRFVDLAGKKVRHPS